MPRAALAALAVAVLVAITSEVLPVGLLPALATGLHVRRADIGFLVSVYAVVVMLGAIPLTSLLDRWPRRAVVLALLAGYAVANGGLALSTGFGAALAFRLLGGLVHAGFFSVVFSLAAEITPRARRGRALAAVSLGNTVGLALGLPAATALGIAVGWRQAFGALALVLAALAVLVPLALPTVHHRRAEHVERRRWGRLPVAGGFIVVLMLGHYLAYTYVTELLGTSGIRGQGTALALFAFGASAALGALVSGVVPETRVRRALAVATLALVAALVALAVGVAVLGVAVAALCVWGAAFGALVPLLQSAALHVSPGTGARAPAVVNAAFNAAITAGSLAGAGLLVGGTPATLALVGAGVAALSLTVLPLLTPRAARGMLA